METKICSICKEKKSLDSFSWKNKKNGTKASECKVCHRTQRQLYYKNNREIEKLRVNKSRRERVKKNRLIIRNLKNACEICGEDRWYCLDFHHKNKKNKEYNINEMLYNFSINRILKEIKKCQVVCANCHREIHHS